jgi:hypothetical protein
MSATSTTLAGRAAAARLMVDACRITRVTGATTDPETGVRTETTTTVYSGRCRLQQRSTGGSRSDVGEVSVVQVSTELQLPTSATGVRPGDTAVMTASVLDPDLVNRAYRVTGDAAKTHLTARRLDVREVAP